MRRILVTGANKGIGLAIAGQILTQHEDTHVLLGSRDSQRGQAALDGLVAANPAWAGRVELLAIDVASDDSVAQAAKQVAAAAPLYGLVNNAGVGFGAADLKSILAVNIVGMHRVCEAFLPLIDPAMGRIVNITSAAGPNFVNECSPERQRFFLDRGIQWKQIESFIAECLAIEAGAFSDAGLGGGDPYGVSKACANSYTLLLARENPSLRINACTPGFIETDLTRHYAEAKGVTPADMGMKSPVEGTVAPLHLLFGELEGNGHYYGSDAKRSPLDRYRAPGTPPYAGE